MKKFLILIYALLTACGGASNSVEINAPIAEVWTYISDSTHAKQWSIFFDHISPMPGIPDGQVGSKRRCFRRADETGMYWDEDVIEIRPQAYRQIHTYNINGFREPAVNQYEYKVEQVFEELSPDRTLVTFKAELLKGFSLHTLLYGIQDFRLSSEILQKNLENIKAQIESKTRPHEYLEKTKWD